MKDLKLIFLMVAICISATVSFAQQSESVDFTEEQERIHQEKIEVGKNLKRNKLENLKSTIEENLKREKEELEEIRKFQVGRSSETKHKQIAEQSNDIMEIERYLKTLDAEIAKTALFKSFPFQSTPEGVVEHVLMAADSADFSKLKFLVDPYGEFDSDVFSFMLIETLPKEGQEEFVKNFENARIMGEPKLDEDSAEMEVAIGPSSNRLEKVQLVKRKDRWYLLSF